ncbi:PKD domain-containing protein [Marinicrinis sediminis]|uniref:PKD domain-containing protein n=1 Tax=Marinicrinis sediminis TaxID=1652465 RepID=A0ABW5RBP0_9BACL
MMYPFEILVTWQAEVEISDEFMGLEITPTEKTLNVGESQHFTVHASWKQNGTTKKYEVSDNKLSWSSNASAKAPVDAFGIVNGQEPTPGTSHASITAYFAEQNASVSAKVRVVDPDEPPPDPDPDPVYITGDFDIVPSEIDWRDPFVFQPKDIETGTCSYQSHQYRIQRGSSSYTTPNVSGETTNSAYSESTYPWIISIGSHQVSMKIIADCGESDWIGPKTLTVNGPADNRPPTFDLGWTTPGDWTLEGKQTEVVQGTHLDLVYLDEPAPADPDGDLIEDVIWDFSSSNRWVKNIPNQYSAYTNGYHQIEMNELGYQSACAIMRDEFGAESRKCTYVRVVPPNPIPVAQCPAEVKHNRPVDASLFGSHQSYSPMGRAIDHTKDEWTNKKTTYTNPATDPIIERLQLHVYDAAGLKSLQPDECEITVLPDLPPLASLDVPPLGIRGQSYTIHNQSVSPDGDVIVSIQYRYKYDAHNNGFEDDNWTSLQGDLTQALFAPTEVGKYRFDATVCEDYGQCDDTLSEDPALLTLDVVNQEPTVSFAVEGENPNPDLTIPDVYTGEDILKNWKLYSQGTAQQIQPGVAWHSQNGSLSTGLGRLTEDQNFYEYNNGSRVDAYMMLVGNYGYGHNNISPYRSLLMPDDNRNQPLMYKTLMGQYNVPRYSEDKPSQIKTNHSYLYFNHYEDYGTTFGGQDYYAIDKSKLVANNYEMNYVHGPAPHYLVQRAEHTYIDEPYAFILRSFDLDGKGPVYQTGRFEKYMDWYNGDFHKANQIKSYQMNEAQVQGYEVSDKTIYQLVQWSCSNCTQYRYNPEYRYATDTIWEIRAYDAFSGSFLGGTYADFGSLLPLQTNVYHSNSIDLSTIGDDVVLSYVSYENITSYQSKKKMEMIKINRKGQVITSSSIPLSDPYKREFSSYGRDYECSPRLSLEKHRDAKGNFYLAEQMYCDRPDENLELWDQARLIKINTDLKQVWKVDVSGDSFNSTGVEADADSPNNILTMIVNPESNEIVVRSFRGSGYYVTSYYEKIDLDSGAVRSFPYTYSYHRFDFYMDAIGAYHPYANNWNVRPSHVSHDGYYTVVQPSSSGKNYAVFDASHQLVTSYPDTFAVLDASGYYATTASDPHKGMLVDDGTILSFKSITSSGTTNPTHYSPWLLIGQPSTQPLVKSPYSFGQFVSNESIEDVAFSFDLEMDQTDAHRQLAGFAFRIQDVNNKYAVETDGDKLYLTRYAQGERTILKQTHFPVQDEQPYSFKLQVIEDRIQVRVDGVPYFDVTDGTYTAGTYGPFSERPYATFSGLTVKRLENPTIQTISGLAIWDEGTGFATVDYTDLHFQDPELDPMAGTFNWTYTHTPKFIQHQGISALHGQQVASAELQLDKVGLYTIELQAEDDPHSAYLYPDDTFADYRKASNAFQRNVIVHRRPVSKYSVIVGGDDKVYWTDSSYDPDRYASSTVYSTEATGIDYLATRGIMERTYFYISPSGEEVMQRLIVPTEAGVYTVGLAVKDEYGAWSEWNIQSVTITDVPQNAPPNPGFTLNKTSTHRGDPITINSSASDPEDGGRTNLDHAYYIRNTSTGVESYQSNSRTSWQKSFSSLGTFQIRQVVRDSVGQEAEMTRSVNILNRLPSAVITYPASRDQNHPTVVKDDTPTITWTYGDADSDSQQRYQVKIYRYGGVLLQDSGVVTSSSKSWTPTTALPDKTNLYVIVRVHDGYAWSLDSEPAYMYIHTNEPPDAQFDWSPKPVWEGDTVTLTNQSTDPDGDPLTYQWRITDPSGQTRSYTSRHVTALFNQIGRYRVELTVSDGEEQDTVTRTIEALELKLEPSVYHTPEWKQIHDDRGHETEHDPKDFYSGELFKLEAVTSPAPVVEITAKLTGTGRQNNVIRIDTTLTASGTPQHYRGDLYDKVLMSMERGLKEGLEDIVFEIEYANGVTKQAVVEVNIIGLAKEIVGVHRVR